MTNPTILVVEDDAAVRQGIIDTLRFAGYEVIFAATGSEGKEKALSANYQLLLLDLVLPHCSGFEILDALRHERPGQATIILSARGEENDRVRGLTMGADDYVVKPFSPRELLARADAVLRRSQERRAASEKLDLAGRAIDFSRAQVIFEGKNQELTQRESDILRCLLAKRGQPVSRAELLRHVWGITAKNVETRTVDMHIAHLRRKLSDDQQKILQTVRGKGYLLTL